MSVITTNSTKTDLLHWSELDLGNLVFHTRRFFLLPSSVYLIYFGITKYQRKGSIQDALPLSSIKFFYALFRKFQVMTETSSPL
jgi:hypothetical protein